LRRPDTLVVGLWPVAPPGASSGPQRLKRRNPFVMSDVS
jgi:hypothetical protein